MAGSDKKPLRQLASEKLHGKGANPSQLGDPVSLKAEAADSEPTNQDRGAKGKGGETLKEKMENKIQKNEKGDQNETMLGDPVSLKAETSKKDPVDHDNGPSKSKL